MANDSKLTRLLNVGGGVIILPFLRHEGYKLNFVSRFIHDVFCGFNWTIEIDHHRLVFGDTILSALLPSDDDDDENYEPGDECSDFETDEGIICCFYPLLVFIN